MDAALSYRPQRTRSDLVVGVVFGTALLVGLGFVAFGNVGTTTSGSYTAHTYCTRDVPVMRSLWAQSRMSGSGAAWQQAVRTMTVHATALGEPYRRHAVALDMLAIAAAEPASAGNPLRRDAVDRAVTTALTVATRDCRNAG